MYFSYRAKDVKKLLAANLAISGLILPAKELASGVLLASTSAIWSEIIGLLKNDWSLAYSIPARKWEELVAGAFDKAGFDEVILTPASGDRGRDVIATKNGVCSVKILGSVKAYRPGHLVSYDDVRALIGVMAGERDASKGIIATTSDFPPLIMDDPYIAPFVPYRLELMNGSKLREWLTELAQASAQSK